MRTAIATVLVLAVSGGASAAQPRHAMHAMARGTAHAAPSQPAADRAVMAIQPLPVIKAYYPQAYRQIAAVVEDAARGRQSDAEIAGSIEGMSHALMGRMSPYYNTDNTIDYMANSRDMLREVIAEAPGQCAQFMRADGHLNAEAREILATMLVKQPGWRAGLMQASLKQAATAPAQPAAGAPNPIVVQAIRGVAIQNVPESLRKYLRPIDPAGPMSPQEAEAACRYTSGLISATLQLPPEQAATTFKQLSDPAHGLWSVSEHLIPSPDPSARLTVAAAFP